MHTGGSPVKSAVIRGDPWLTPYWAGITVDTGGSPVITQNRIHDELFGVIVHAEGSGDIEGNELYGTMQVGMEANSDPNPCPNPCPNPYPNPYLNANPYRTM